MAQDLTQNPAYKAAEVYETFFVPAIFRYWTPVFLERVAPQPGERVLDVACGTGVVARNVVPLVKPAGQVIGLDINPAMLEVACKQFADHCEEIEWREGRAESLPFPDRSFDLVTCQQGLQFFTDRPAAAREMQRVVRKGGRVGIEVWQCVEDNSFYQQLYETIGSVLNVPMQKLATAFAFGDADALGGLLQEAGFREVMVESVCQNAFFRDPRGFVKLTLRAVSAVIPEFKGYDAALQSELLETANRKVAGLIQQHTIDGVLTVPLKGNIATGTG